VTYALIVEFDVKGEFCRGVLSGAVDGVHVDEFWFEWKNTW
jgi:hypothetical protein